jgi:hypothetical protein
MRVRTHFAEGGIGNVTKTKVHILVAQCALLCITEGETCILVDKATWRKLNSFPTEYVREFVITEGKANKLRN